MFFFYKNKKIKNNFFLKNYLSWLEKFFFWKYCYLTFFFDDLFAIIFKRLSKNFFLIPGFYFFDKYFSYWNSYNFFKKKFYFFSFKLYLEKNNNLFYLLYILIFFFIYYFFLIIFITIF